MKGDWLNITARDAFVKLKDKGFRLEEVSDLQESPQRTHKKKEHGVCLAIPVLITTLLLTSCIKWEMKSPNCSYSEAKSAPLWKWIELSKTAGWKVCLRISFSVDQGPRSWLVFCAGSPVHTGNLCIATWRKGWRSPSCAPVSPAKALL